MAAILILLLSVNNLCCQNLAGFSTGMGDLNNRVLSEVRNFQDYLEIITQRNAPDELRLRAIQKCLLLFTDEAIIEWEYQQDRSPIVFSPEAYLNQQFHKIKPIPFILDIEVVQPMQMKEINTSGLQGGRPQYMGQIVLDLFICVSSKFDHIRRAEIDCTSRIKYRTTLGIHFNSSKSIKGEFFIGRFDRVHLSAVKN